MTGKFIMIPRGLYEDDNIQPLDIVIYGALDIYASADGEAWPSLAALGKRAKVGKMTVVRSLSRLEKAGYIQKTIRKKAGSKEFDSTFYNLLFRKESGKASGVGCETPKPGAEVGSDSHKVVSERDKGLSLTETRLSLTGMGVVSEVDRNYTHITIPNIKDKTPLTPLGGNDENFPAAFPSKGAFEISETSVEKTKAKDETKAKAKYGRRARGPDGEAKAAAKKAHGERVEARFADVWQAYPKKDGEAAARRAFAKLFPQGRKEEAYEAILQRIQARATVIIDGVEAGEQNVKYVKNLANWLRDEDFSHD